MSEIQELFVSAAARHRRKVDDTMNESFHANGGKAPSLRPEVGQVWVRTRQNGSGVKHYRRRVLGISSVPGRKDLYWVTYQMKDGVHKAVQASEWERWAAKAEVIHVEE